MKNLQEKEKSIIPAFALYRNEVGDESGNIGLLCSPTKFVDHQKYIHTKEFTIQIIILIY